MTDGGEDRELKVVFNGFGSSGGSISVSSSWDSFISMSKGIVNRNRELVSSGVEALEELKSLSATCMGYIPSREEPFPPLFLQGYLLCFLLASRQLWLAFAVLAESRIANSYVNSQ